MQFAQWNSKEQYHSMSEILDPTIEVAEDIGRGTEGDRGEFSSLGGI